MNNTLKRALSILMVMVMLIGMMPANAFADTSNDLLIGGPENDEGEPKVVTVTVSPAQITMRSTDKASQITAAVDGAEAKNVTWSIVSGDDVITVDGNGLTADVAPKSNTASGEAVVRATYQADGESEEVYADCTVTVNLDRGSVEVTPSQVTMFTSSLGADLSAVVLPVGASQEVAWSSSAPNVASVDDNGFVTPHSAGTAIIKATAQGTTGESIEDFCTVTVKEVKYRVIYNSNYPEDAMKFAYRNGNKNVNNDSSPLVQAADTNAVYEVVGGQEHTIISGMTCANYDFAGWSEAPDAAEADAQYAPGSSITVNGNQTFYAVWQKNTATETKKIYIDYCYVNSANKSIKNTRSVTAYLVGQDENGNDLYSFQLGNCADGLVEAAKDDKTMRGWTVNGENYNFNATCISTLDAEDHVRADAWQDKSLAGDEAYAQFFVHKYRLDATNRVAGTETVNYYSVGTGKVNVYLPNVKDRVGGSTSDDVSEYLVEKPDIAQIASALDISLSDTENIRWFKVVKASDGYHVDGIIYTINKNWTVKFIDPLADGKVARSVNVEDKGSLKNFPAGPYHAGEEFECWVDEAGKEISSIDVVVQNRTLYAKYKNKLILNGYIDHGTVTNSSQVVFSGQKTLKMDFTADPNYTITSVLVNDVAQKIDSGKTTYTFTARTLNKNTYVIVNTKGVNAVIRFDANGGTGEPSPMNGEFGAPVEDPFPTKQPVRPGYTFDGWYTDAEGGSKVTGYPSLFDQVETVYYAHWTSASAKYTVEYYYQADGGYPDAADSSAEFSGTTGSVAKVTNADKTSAKDGYVFDSSAAGNVLTGTVSGDGTLVLKVYFKQQFTVNYRKGEHGTFTETSHTALDYNAPTPEGPETTGEAGYSFAGWRDEAGNAPADKVTGDATYTAQWTVNTDAGYVVHYYLLGTEIKAADDKIVNTAVFGEEYTENAAVISGYEAAGETTQKVIAKYDDNEITFYYYKNVTVTAKSYTAEYTGTAIVQTLDAVVDGTIGEDTIAYTVAIVEGEAVELGSYTVRPAGDEIQGYYKVEYVDGTLTVTPATKEVIVTIKGASATENYDGEAHTVSGFDVTLPDGTKLTASDIALADGVKAEASQTNAGTAKMGLTAESFVCTNANYTNVKFVVTDGSVTVTKKAITVTAEDGEWNYDGKAHSKNEYKVEGLVKVSDIASVTVEGTITLPGTAENVVAKVTFADGMAGNYELTTAKGTLTVKNRTEKYEINLVPNTKTETYDGTEKTVSGFETTTFTVDGNTYTVEGLTAGAKGTDANSYTVAVTGTPVVKDSKGNDVTAQFNVKYPTDSKLIIEKRNVTLTSGSDKKAYDGSALTNSDMDVTGDGFAAGEGAAYTFTGSQTLVGSSENTFTYTLNKGTKADNYNIVPAYGTLEVTDRDEKYEINLVPNTDTATYDGEKHTVEGFEETTFTVDGKTYTVTGITAGAEGTDADSYTVVVTGTPVVKDADGNDVTAQFDVKYPTDSKLVINKRNVTLTSDSANKTFDGKALTKEGMTVGGDGFVKGEGATYTYTGSQTLVGSSDNTFTYTLNAGTKEDNYNIVPAYGTLEVTNRGEKYEINLVPNTKTETYDGTEKTVEGFETTTFTVDGNTYTVEGLTAGAKGTDAGSYTVAVTGTPVVKDAQGNDVTAQFAVKYPTDSKLVINKRNVTLTSDSASKTFDGKPLTKEGMTVGGDGFVDGEGAAYSYTGSQTLVGTSDNTFTYVLNAGTKEGNYNIVPAYGTLEVTNRGEKYEINLVPNTKTETYDGTEKTVSGFETTTFTVDGNTYTVEGLTAGAKGTDANSYTVVVSGTPVVKDAKGNDVTGQFNVKYPTDEKLVIEKRNVTLTSGSDKKAYDGSALTNSDMEVGGDGFAAGEGAAYTFTGSQTLVGSSENTFTYTLDKGTKADNYNIVPAYGTLEVTERTNKPTVEVIPNTKDVPYNGEEQTVGGSNTHTYTDPNGNTYEIVNEEFITGTGTDADEYSITSDPTKPIIILDQDGNDVTDQFEVVVPPAVFHITKRNVILTSGSAEKTYDGQPLTKDEVTVSGDGFVKDEGVNCTVTGTITEVGQTKNTFTYELKPGTNADNYSIKTNEGELKIKADNAKIVVQITGVSVTETFTGETFTAKGFKVTLPNGTQLTEADIALADGAKAEASRSDVGTTKMGLSAQSFVCTNSNYANVSFAVTDGFVKVNPAAVTVTADNQTKVYGETLDPFTAKVDGVLDNAAINYTIERESSSMNAGSYTLTPKGNETQGNYKVTFVPGSLTIQPMALEITGASKNWEYDGKTHSCDEYQITSGKLVGKDAITDITLTGSVKELGDTCDNVPSDAKIKTGDERNYTVTYKPGKLEIVESTEEIVVTIKGNSKTTDYTGKEQSVSGYTIESISSGMISADSIRLKGTAKASGTDAGTYQMNLTADSFECTDTRFTNVKFQVTDGTLTINPASVTVTADSQTVVYGNEPETFTAKVDGAKASKLTFTVKVDGDGKDVGIYDLIVEGSKDQGNYDVTFVPGKLTVTPRTLNITADSQTWEYDGKEHSLDTYTVGEGELAAGDSITSVTVTGTIKTVGEAANVPSDAVIATGNAKNYTVKYNNGKLTVTACDDEIVVKISGNSETKVYDGDPATAEGFVITSIDGDLFTADDLKLKDDVNTSVSRTDVGTTNMGLTADSFEVTNPNFSNVKFEVTDGFVTITPKTVTVTADDKTVVYGDDLPELTAKVDGAASSDLTFTVKVDGDGKNVGTYDLTVEGDKDQGNYEVTFVPGKLTVTSRTLNITAGSKTWEYDGSYHALESYKVGRNELVKGDKITYVTVTGTIQNVGEVENVPSDAEIVTGSKDNYTVVYHNGKLAVTPYTGEVVVKISGNSETKTYDATPATAEGYSIDSISSSLYAAENVKLSSGVNAQASRTDAGKTEMGLTADSFENTNTNFSNVKFEVTDGFVQIDAKEVTVTAKDGSWTYDGNEHSLDAYEVNGLVKDSDITSVTISGTVKLPGTAENKVASVTFADGMAQNYTLKTEKGTLTITNREGSDKYEINLVPNTDEVTYDGTKHTVDGFEQTVFEIDGNTYTVEEITSGTEGTDAGEYDVEIKGTPVVKDSNGNDVTDQFNITYPTDSKLIINKRNVTLTSDSDSKVYDGEALTNDKVTVSGDGFAAGEGAKYDVTGSQTLVGSSDNTFTYTLENAKAENYNITVELGTLEVKARTDKPMIVIDPKGDDVPYNGEEQTVGGSDTKTYTDPDTGAEYTIENVDEITGTGTDVGEYPITPNPDKPIIIRDKDGNDVTDQFDIEVPEKTFKIIPREVTLTSGSAKKTFDGNALTKDEVTVSGDGFAAGEGAKYDVTGSQTLVGSSDNTFTYTLKNAKAENYNITVVYGTLEVTSRTDKPVIVIDPKGGDVPYNGEEQTVGGSDTKTYTDPETGNEYTIENVDEITGTGTDVGEYPITPNPDKPIIIRDKDGNDVTDQFDVEVPEKTFKIVPREVTLTSGSAEKTFDGNALTKNEVTVSGDGFVKDEGAKYDVTGSQTLVGTSDNTFTYTLENAKAENYNITVVYGTLTVKARTDKPVIVIDPKGGDVPYNGEEQTVGGSDTDTYTDPETGNEYTIEHVDEITGTGTDVGEYPITPNPDKPIIIRDKDGNDVTDQFDIEVPEKTFKIVPREVTLTSGSGSKVYDGNALTNEEVTVSGDGFAKGEGAKYDVTGSQTLVGTSDNTFTYTLENAKAENYNITVVYGTLEVSKRTEKPVIVIDPKGGDVPYNGEEQTVGGSDTDTYTDPETGNEYTIEHVDEITGTGTDVGEYPITPNPDKPIIIRDKDGNDVTDQFDIEVPEKTFKILPLDVTITSGSDSKVYDGNPLTNSDVTIGGEFAKGEGVDVTVTGSQTLVGTSDNTFTYTLKNAKAENYNITVAYGTLEVTSRTDKPVIVIDPKGGDVPYNGEEQTVGGSDTKTYTDPDTGAEYTIENVDEITGTGTDVGEYPITPNPDKPIIIRDKDGNDVTDQFDIEVPEKTFKIVPREVIITTESVTKTYDGEELTGGKVTVTGDGFVPGDGVEINITGKQTDAGSSENTVEVSFKDGTKPENYHITVVPGTLTVTPRTLNITAASQTWEYDGNVHTLDAYTVGEGDLVGSDTVTSVTVTGSVQYANQPADNVPSNAVVNTANADNYAIVYHNGTLTITDRANKFNIELIGVSGKSVYDGTEQSIEGFSLDVTENSSVQHFFASLFGSGAKVDGVTFTAGGSTYTVTGVTASAKRTDAGVSDVTFSGKVVVLDASGNDVSEQFNISTKNGTFEIAKRNVVLQSASDAKVFDGTELTNATVIIGGKGGFVTGEEAALTYVVTGSQTEVGESENIFTYALDEAIAKASNYDIQVVYGTLTVSPVPTNTLTIHYQYANGTPAADDFVGQFAAGQPYTIYSPVIAGFHPDFLFITSGEGGMPGTDLTLVVTYYQDAVNNNDTPEAPEAPEAPTEPTGGIIEENPQNPGTYELIPIAQDEVPLAQGAGHVDDILHFLLIAVAAIVEFIYFDKRKKYQEKIFELKKKLGDTSMDEE